MIRSLIVGALCAGLSLALAPPRASANAPLEKDLGGQLRAESNGRPVQFPALKTDITADVQGDLATVTVIQTFTNPTSTPLNATYLFPLSKDSAVHAMQMRVGDELVTAKIDRKEAARQTFEQGKREGKTATLLEQHRPNMFQQNLANLMPGLPITVTLKYVQTVPRVDGAYQLEIPLIVGPRYMPAGSSNRDVLASIRAGAPASEPQPDTPPAATPAASGEWSFGPPPKYPPVIGLTIPSTIDQDRVSIHANLAAGMPITGISSTTHTVTTSGEGNARTVTLASGRTIDNRDFVLRYGIAAEGIQVGLLAHRDAESGTLSLMIEPPKIPDAADITPREIVFLLDTSGSMSGMPIDASKTFMKHALQVLRTSDYFRIIRFSNNASEFTAVPVRATPSNLAAGLAYVNSLHADGGTDVMTGLRQTFSMPPQPNARRILVFLSDGYVGNEAEILRMVSANIDQTRTYVFGIGAAVNRYLLAEMAHQGRGFVRFVDPTEGGHDAAMAFANKLKNTVMTDLAIDWGNLQVTDMTPAALPDLFEGDAIRVQARFKRAGKHVVKVNGKINGRSATLPLEIELPATPTGDETAAIPLIWARSHITDAMRELMTPANLRTGGRSNADIETRVTELGLKHSLATQWTSFVAVSQKVFNIDPAAAVDTSVPLPMVKGVGPGAYGVNTRQAAYPMPSGTQVAGLPQFSGGSTPEPETLFGLILVMLSIALGLRRRRKAVA